MAPDDDSTVIPFPSRRIHRRRAGTGLMNEYRGAA